MVTNRGGAAVVLWVVVLVAAAAAAPALSSQAVASPRDDSTFVPPDGTRLPADQTGIRIKVRPDRSAIWEVQYRAKLDGDDASSTFESVRKRIDEDPVQYTGPFAKTMDRAAVAAAEEIGRNMEIRNVTVRARELPSRFGVVTYRFEWTSFAGQSGGDLVIGDALVGFFLSERTTLVVQWPEDSEPERISPSPDETRSRAAVWEGPVEFAPDEPRVVVTGAGVVPFDLLGVAALAVVLTAVGLVGWRRYRKGTVTVAEETDETGDPAATGAVAGSMDDSADDHAVADDTTAANPEGTADEVPEELLSDAERVLNLLERNGGRMKQQDTVAALDWSETKTSQVVRDLKDEEKIEVYRLGRENVLALPGEMDV